MKTIIKLCLTGGLGGGIILGFRKIPGENEKMLNMYLFNYNLGCFLAGYAFVILLPYLFYKLQLHNKNDMLKYISP